MMYAFGRAYGLPYTDGDFLWQKGVIQYGLLIYTIRVGLYARLMYWTPHYIKVFILVVQAL